MAGEYKGDFTRDTFHPFRHYSRVLLQQGRVQLDADWNEQAAILLHLLRLLGKDTQGEFKIIGDAFRLSAIPSDLANGRDFFIMPGRAYLDGILCRLEGAAIPFAAKDAANGISTVSVSEWLVDGIPFKEKQYVELSGTSGQAPVVAKQMIISAAYPNLRTLTLKSSVSGLGDPASFCLRRLTTYRTQPDFPLPREQDPDRLDSKTKRLVYLDVWERHITYLQDTGIREIALGGPDTAARSKILSQVKIDFTFDASNITSNSQDDLKTIQKELASFQPYNRGWLQARTKPAPDASSLDPCITHPDARYRGAENQLYRVEIHTGSTEGAGQATFKWSRENGSVVFPILSVSGTDVFLESLGHDSRFGLKVDDWVEILDDDLILQGQPAQLFQVAEIHIPGRRVVLKPSNSGNPVPILPADPNHPHPFLRRWDHKDTTGKGITIQEVAEAGQSCWIDLEDGIQIQFQPALSPATADGSSQQLKNQYRSGDYWLIPARTAENGVIDWPTTMVDTTTISIALPPHGIEHHYAPLGLVWVDDKGNLFVTPL